MVVPNIQQQMWRGVRRAWQSIARAGGIAAIAGIVIGEIFGALFNGGHNTFFIHLMALVLALAMAYGAVITVGIFQAIRGVFGIVGDLEAQVRSQLGNVVDAERKDH